MIYFCLCLQATACDSLLFHYIPSTPDFLHVFNRVGFSHSAKCAHVVSLRGTHFMYPLANLIFNSQIRCRVCGSPPPPPSPSFKSCPIIDPLFQRTLLFPLITFCSILNYVGLPSVSLFSRARMLCVA